MKIFYGKIKNKQKNWKKRTKIITKIISFIFLQYQLNLNRRMNVFNDICYSSIYSFFLNLIKFQKFFFIKFMKKHKKVKFMVNLFRK